MNWDAIGAIGEIVGAIAVVVSLVYVAYQVRQNTAALKVSTLQDLIANQTSAQNVVASSPQVAELWQRADDAYDELTPAEHKQFMMFIISMLNVLVSARSNYEAGLQSEEVWKGWIRGYALVIKSSPGWQREWANLREVYVPLIGNVVDEIMSESEAGST